MKNKLQIALIQTPLIWENAQENRELLENKIISLTLVDLIILPEMFSTGFTMKPQNVAETMNGKTINWLKNMASLTDSAICGSLIIEDQGRFYNRFVFVEPSSELRYYDKRHRFTLAGEHKSYDSGTKKIILEYKGWKICPLICYDLRFPVWSRNIEGYDLLLYVANWPKNRIHAWDVLLQARAIENLAFTVGVNRIGCDHMQLEYPGHSAVYDALGAPLVFSETEEILFATLDKESLFKHRNTLKFLDDRDHFTVN